MKQVDPIEKAKIFLSQNAVRQNSWTRTLCYLTFDILLFIGLAWHIRITYQDWDYWKDAPNSFNIFILNQYILLALCIRFPATSAFKQTIITRVSILLGFLLLINTIMGTIQFFQLTELEENSQKSTVAAASSSSSTNKPAVFDLNDQYLAHGAIMILIPWSIFFFLIIVLVKVICFFWVEHKKRDHSLANRNEARKAYGSFNDDEVDHETEAVIGVYFRIMERVKFQSQPNPETHAYMID